MCFYARPNCDLASSVSYKMLLISSTELHLCLQRKEIALVTAGILMGITVKEPTKQAFAGLMFNPSNQRFCVNKQRVSLEAYGTGGSNFVKLRGIGQEAGSVSPTMPPSTPSTLARTSPMKQR